MAEKDYYQVLEVPHGASAGAIESSYWDLALKYNGSLPTDPTLARLMEELNEAYRVLATPDLRRNYDRARGIGPAAVKRRRRFLWFGRKKEERLLAQAAGVVSPPAVATRSDAAPVATAAATAVDALEPVARREAVEPVPAAEEHLSAHRESRAWVRWEMPPLQAFVVSVGVAVIFVLALAAGADPGLTLILGGVTVFFALFPWRFGRPPVAPGHLERLERRREDVEFNAQVLRDSTAAIVARWRQGGSPGGGTAYPSAAHQPELPSRDDGDPPVS